MTKNIFPNFRLLKKKCLIKTKFTKKRKKKINFVILLLFQWFSFGLADRTEEQFLDRNQKNTSEIFFCENCEISEEKFRLREIKNEILGKLGMTEEPKNFLKQRNAKKKEFFYETNLFQGEVENEEEDELVEEQELISYAKIGEIYKNSRLIEFSPQTTLDDNSKTFYQIQKAFLYVKTTPNMDYDEIETEEQLRSSSTPLKIWIFQIFEDEVTLKEDNTFCRLSSLLSFQSLHFISSEPISFDWQKFDVTPVIKNWYSSYTINKQRKLRILIDCTGCSHHRLRHKQIKTLKNFDNQTKLNSFLSKRRKSKNVLFQKSPFLVTSVKKTQKQMIGISRKRRHVKCSGETRTGECCLQPFYVSFRNLGWENWIVAPSGYFSNYCRGKCAHGNGSYRQSNYQRFFSNFDTNFDKCCAPVKFSKMSLIYYGDDGGLVKRDLEKMIVEECACFF
ncbi:INHBB family protein [Megaselia abdita]